MFRPQSGTYEKTMTTIKNVNGILAGLLLLAAGCADNNPWNEGGDVGALRPEVLVDAAVGAAVTRAQMEELPEADVPSASDFTLEITKSDGSYSKSWLFADYDPESVALRSGKYIVTARYGDPREEGSKRPYFVGSADVTVKTGETTPVNIEAALGNALVEVTQTDNFLNYFSDFSLQLHSGETGAYVPVSRGQTDPTYVHPGQVDVVLSYTNWEGKSATVRPVSMTVEAKKFYHVKLDLDTEVNSGVLRVTFENGVEEEEVEIDLSAVENSPEPTITTSDATEQSLLMGTRCSETPKFTLFAPAGIKSVTLNLDSDPVQKITYLSGEELCVTDSKEQESIKAALEATGIKSVGLFRNRDKMAEIDLSDFVMILNPGTHKLEVTLTDNLGRYTSESLDFRVVEPAYSIESVGTPVYGATEVGVTVSYNGLNVMEDLSFSVRDGSGTPAKANIKSVKKLTDNTGDFPMNIYEVILEETPKMLCSRDLWVRIGDKTIADSEPADAVATPAYPEYSVEVDAFAKHAYLRIKAEDSEVSNYLRNKLKTSVGEIKNDKSPASDIIYISGFDPAQKYNLQLSLEDCATPETYKEVEFTTEEAAEMPNGDFAESKQTINETEIKVGGDYRVSPVDYHIFSSIVISEPTGWASVNAKTCYEGSSNKNTWYMVPSTYVDNNSVIVRSVAYDHSGGPINKSGGSWNTHYYCQNAPESISSRAAGELFLGSYSFDGSEHRDEGISFSSRPSSITFEIISFEPYEGENGVVSIEVLDKDGNVLCSKEDLIDEAKVVDNNNITLDLSYNDFKKKAAKLKVKVKSSSADVPATKIPKDSELNEHQGLGNHTIAPNSYHALSTGSVLKIKSIHLNYD